MQRGCKNLRLAFANAFPSAVEWKMVRTAMCKLCTLPSATADRGWEIPLFQHHWRAAGLEPGDIRSLDDLLASIR